MDGVRSASRLAYANRDTLNCSLGFSALILIGNFLLKRYQADIGVRADKTKVGVEDLAAYLDPDSNGISVDKTKLPVEDSAVYLDSSTAIGVKKSTVPVEDVPVFLESSTGKKPLLKDLGAYHDSSTDIDLHMR